MNIKKKIMSVLIILFIGIIGCKKTADDGKSGGWRFKYNANGQLAEAIRPDKHKIEYHYNERGQLASIKYETYENQFKYNRLGFITQTIDQTGSTVLGRDLYGRLEKMVYPQGDEVNYRYNEDGNITKVTWGNRHFLEFKRDLMGRTIRMETPAGAFQMLYDYDKRMMQRIYPNGALSQFTFNRDGRPTLIRHALPDKRLILEFRYTYNNAGLLEVAHEMSINKEVTIKYTYDKYDQLIKAAYSDGRVYSYEYDPYGNRVKCSAPTGSVIATYDTRDLIRTLQGKPVKHDPEGNITNMGESTFTYNVKDALIDDGIRQYKYNALGLRVEASGKGGTTAFVHLIDDLPYVLAEKGKTNKKYLWNDGQCLGQIADDNRVVYFFEDHLGSIRCAMDQAGNVTGHAEYSPFGVPIQRIPGVRFGFAGEEQDEEGKVFLRARYYEPKIGRFLSKDPMTPQLMASVKQNRYAYAANSPTDFNDPDGASPNYNDQWRKYGQLMLYPFSLPQQLMMESLKRAQDSARFIIDRANETSQLIPNIWGLREPGRLLSEGRAVSNFFYTKPTMSHTSLWHDAFLEHYRIGEMNPVAKHSINIISMLPAWGLGAGHYVLDYIGGPELTSDLRNFLWEKAHPDIYGRQDSQEQVNYLPNTFTTDLRRQGFYPPFPPDGGGGMLQTPNVGGVYLNKAAEVIGNLSVIKEVAFDPVTNRVILIGSDSDQTKLPSIRIDDLAAAFRSVFGDYPEEPGVTIDPDPQNPKAKQMIVRFFGGMENTHFGHVLFEADRQMKALSLGKDNINQQPVSVKVEGYYNMLQLAFSNLAGPYKKELWSRFWLVPEQVIVKVSDDKKSITFPDTRIRVKTETMQWQKGKLVPAKGLKDKQAEYFAAHFTKYYDDYAREFPVYRELKNLTNLVALAKWLKDSGVNPDFTWMKTYDKPYQTAKTTPSLTVEDSQGRQMVSIFGGTDLTVKNLYVKELEKGSTPGKSSTGGPLPYTKKAIQAIGSSLGIANASFIDDNNKQMQAVALPTSKTLAAGVKILREYELELIPRTFCSSHNEAGEFRHSWVLEVPKLIFSRPQKDKEEYTGVGDNKVLVREFRLTKHFGLLDVTFKKYEVDQQRGCIAVLPDKYMGIQALYPDDKKGEYRIEYTNGGFDVFNDRGQLVRSRKTLADFLEYEYDGYYRLVKVTQKTQAKTVKQLILQYDNQGRISSAETLSGTISYTYEPKNNLVKVVTGKDTIEYTYDNRHLVTGVRINGEPVSTYEYDGYGRILVEKEGKENPIKKGINYLPGGKIEIVESIDNQKRQRIYDAGGRLLEVAEPTGDKIEMAYNERSELKDIVYTNRFGDKSKIRHSTDGRQITHMDAEGNIRSFIYDEFGRLKQIQDDQYILVKKDYGMTDRGWMENTETTEKTAQAFFDQQENPIEYILTSNVPGGGQVKVKNDYNADGILRQEQIRGLINENREYENGRLKKMTSGEDATQFQYDPEGRLEYVVSSNEQVSYEYNREGDLQSLKMNKGDGEESYSFKDGLLSGRKSIPGRTDSFRYDKEGKLVEVQKGNNEKWEVKQEGNRVIILRNDRVYVEAVYDNENRVTEIVE